MQGALCGYELTGRWPRGTRGVLVETYQTLDERQFLIASTNPARDWPLPTRAVGHPEWQEDPRFADPMTRYGNTPILLALLDEIFGADVWQAWRERLTAGGLTFGIVGKVEDHIADEQLEANAMLPEFEKETGIKVQFQRLVYSEMHDKLVTQLTGQSSYYNVLEVDFLWAGEFPEAGWLADLQPFADKTNFDLKPFIPAMMDLVGRHKGTLYMIPMYNYSMGLIYRTDLLDDAKLQAAYKSAPARI